MEWLTFDDSAGREVYWHSTAHLLAQAVRELFPQAKLAIGPPIEDGFYYDFDIGRPFTPEDLDQIEARMRELARRDEPIERFYLPRAEAAQSFLAAGEKYKAELLAGIPDDPVGFYRQDGFQDMCRGPHLLSTGRIKAIKLLSTSGAYWRGDEHREMLQRIYGVSFPAQEALDRHLARLEEAKRRDHRKLGRDLQLFTAAGDYLGEWTDVARPCQVFLDRAGWVYVAELGFRAGRWPGTGAHAPSDTGGRVSVFDRQGTLRSRWGGGHNPCAPGDFFAPHGLWVDSRGDLYVAEVALSAGARAGLVPASCHTLQKFVRQR